MRQSGGDDNDDLPSFAEAVTTLFNVCKRNTAGKLQLNEMLLEYANSLVAGEDRDQVADDLRWLIDILSDVAFAIVTPASNDQAEQIITELGASPTDDPRDD